MSTNPAQEAFINGAIGRGFDMDGAYGNQCVDLADAYSEALFGNWRSTFGTGNATNHWPKNNGYWTAIKPTGDNRPLRGDVIVWGGSANNPAGHIAIVYASTKTSVSVVQQNYNSKNPGHPTEPATLNVMPYSFAGMPLKGWLRPNVQGATVPDPGEIEVGDGGASGGATPYPIRQDNQRWAVADCEIKEAPSPSAKKTGELKERDLVTMEGYVLGEWFSYKGEGSSFWFKVKSKGMSGGSGRMDWDLVAERESNGRWNLDSHLTSGFCGGLQFLQSTWDEFGGRKYAPCAHMATREQQIEIAEKVLDVQGPNAWPNTHQGAYHPEGTVSSSLESVTGYVPFAYFDPLETFGVPDITQYETWKTYVPNPPNLPANAPEAHWDGNVWQGWQWNDSRTEVVWKTPSGQIYTGAYISSGGQIEGGAYPEPVPTQGPVAFGSVSTDMWNYLLSQGWGPIKTQDVSLLTVSYDEVVGNFEMKNTAAEGAWYWLIVHANWHGIPTDREERIYAPSHPRYGETVYVGGTEYKERWPVLPGSDVTNRVAMVLQNAGWVRATLYGSDKWIVPPDGYITHG